MAEIPCGIGIVGAGHIGRAHARTWRETPGAAVRAIADLIPERANAVAQEFEIPHVYTDYRSILARDDVQIVAVCTPPFAHYLPTVEALGAGKHVLCEKPFALRVEEAEQMVAAARAAERYLAMASARVRYGLGPETARRMVAAGELGRIYHGRSTVMRQRGRPGIDILKESTWFLSKERAGGGALIDIGVYDIDLMLWLMGNPRVRSVSATITQGIGEPRPDLVQEVEDHATVMCQLEGGASLVIESAWASHLQGHTTRFVLGDRGGLRLNPLTFFGPPPPGERECTSRRVLPEGVEDQHQGGFAALTRAFVAAVRGEGPPPMTPAEDALVVTRVIAAAYESAGAGRPVVFD